MEVGEDISNVARIDAHVTRV